MTINKKYWNNVLVIYVNKEINKYTLLVSYKDTYTSLPAVIYNKFKKKKSKNTYIYIHSGHRIIKKKIRYKDVFLNLFVRSKFKRRFIVRKKKIY